MKIAIIGRTGQLGSDLDKILSRHHEILDLPRDQIDLRSNTYHKYFQNLDFDILINTAAIHNISYAEENPSEAFQVNSNAPFELAKICKDKNKIFIHFSTDYVFDGQKKTPYSEQDECNPLSIYGKSKREGEVRIQSLNSKFYIFRVSSLFGEVPPRGKQYNFVDAIIHQARDNKELKVVSDQKMCATSTKSIAEMIKDILDQEIPYGIYHFANEGELSWLDYAKLALSIAKIDKNIKPLFLNDLQTIPLRPQYSCLALDKLKNHIKTLPITHTLKEFIQQKYAT